MSYVKMRSLLLRVWGAAERDEGQALVEFSLMLALVALVCVLALTALGATILGLIEPFPSAFGG